MSGTKKERAKRSTIKESNEDISNSLNLNSKINSFDVLNLLVKHLKEEHNFNSEQIKNLIKKDKEEIMIPVSVFNDKLSSLETITKYLTEVVNLKNKEIAKLLNRNVRTIWTTYNNAIKKLPQKFVLSKEDQFLIPTSKLKNRWFSTLEVIVKHLKEDYALSFHDIAVLLKRNDSTVWTVYSRVKKKEKRET